MEDLSSEQLEEVESFLFAGQKIQAIKAVRESTGMGLAESKDFVEKHERLLRDAYPDKMPASKAGCGAASLIFLAMTLGATSLYLCL
ncbi:MAG TPA: hypothetical protein DER01_17905 [Phycisphaerales bacterium]|nr:hypothetical protein [Phycisphaerales bacterium]|tara:strand:- start:2016 stop:2276 length:261 start_codon:yes stop_codon:yes gene_type:complete